MGMTSVARFVVLFGVICVLPTSTFAQSSDERPRVQVVRVEPGAVRVDGTLGDTAWNLATPATNFTQREPNEGELARDRMDVRFLYDDAALYVGARMYSSQPVQASLYQSQPLFGDQCSGEFGKELILRVQKKLF